MRDIIASPRTRMLIVGAFSVVLAYTTFLLLITLGVHYLIASTASFVTYIIVNFFLNKIWTFKSKGDTKKEAAAHFTLHLTNQVMIMIGLYVLVEWISIPAAWSQIIMQVITFLIVFTVTPIIFKSS